MRNALAKAFATPTVGNAIGWDFDDTPGLDIYGDDDWDSIESDLDEIEGDLESDDPYMLAVAADRLRGTRRRGARLQRRAASGRPVAVARLQKMANKQARLEKKFARKQARLAARMGVSPGAVAAVGPQGVYDRERLASESAAYADAGQFGVIERTPYKGVEIRIPFELSGSPVQLITIAPGAGVRTVALSLQTEQIPYGSFIVRGLDATVKVARGENASGFPNQDILWNLVVDSAKVEGKTDLLYKPTLVEMAAQGSQDANRTKISLRSNPELEVNNRATLTATFRQEITTAVEYNATVSFALIVEELRDPAASSSF